MAGEASEAALASLAIASDDLVALDRERSGIGMQPQTVSGHFFCPPVWGKVLWRDMLLNCAMRELLSAR